MKKKLPIDLDAASSGFPIRNRKSEIGNGFSLVEVLIVVSLMSLIVLALMAVFSSTQKAFRAAVTQTDVLEGSRATIELITADLRGLTPSGGVSNLPAVFPNTPPKNFFVYGNTQTGYRPLVQNLAGSSAQRTNLLNYFFVLGRENTKWTGVGYIVVATNDSPLYPLYRFYAETNITLSPSLLFDAFNAAVVNQQWTNMSHLIDGVVHLTLHAHDPSGKWINDYPLNYTNAANTLFLGPAYGGEAQMYMFSNTVPASLELEMGVLEDNALARAEPLPDNLPAAPPLDRRSLYLAEQAGKVHLFRQRVTIPNVDPTAYQP